MPTESTLAASIAAFRSKLSGRPDPDASPDDLAVGDVDPTDFADTALLDEKLDELAAVADNISDDLAGTELTITELDDLLSDVDALTASAVKLREKSKDLANLTRPVVKPRCRVPAVMRRVTPNMIEASAT